MDLVVYDERDRRYVPLLVALGAAVIAGMVLGGIAYEAGRARPVERVGGVSEPAAGTREEQACTAALERADAALAVGSRLEVTLQEQSAVMDDLLAGRVTRQQALDRAVPPLTLAAADRRAFLEAVTTYRTTRDACLP